MRFFKTKKTSFVVSTTYRAFFLSTVLAKLSGTLCEIIDSMLVGQFLGTEQLAAMSFLKPVLVMRSALTYLLTGGVGILCAYYIGSNDRKRINNLFTIAMGAATVAGALLTLAFTLGAPLIVSLFGAEQGTKLYADAIDYLNGYGLGMVPMLLNYLLTSLVTVNGSKDLVVHSTIVLGVLGVLSDLLMVLVVKNGLYGVGLATSLSYLAATLVLCIHFLRPANIYRLTRPRNVLRELWQCLERGSIQGFNRVAISVGGGLQNAILYAAGGTAALAAMGVYNTVNDLVFNFILGGNSCMCNMVSMFTGEKDRKSMARTFAASLRMQSASLAVCFVLVTVFAPQICFLFGVNSGEALAYGVFALRWFAVGTFGAMVYKLFAGAQEGMGRTKFTLLYVLGNNFLITLPLVYLFSRLWGAKGAFCAMGLAELVIALLCVTVIRLKQGRLTNWESWFFLPKDWSDEGKELAFYMDEKAKHYMHAVRHIAAFCEANGLDEKTSNSIMLCTEEITALILENGRSRKEYENIDFRCLLEKDAVYIRLRFVGKPYNPLADPKLADSVSMKILQGMTESREYSYNLDMNVIILKYRVECKE